MSKQNIKFIDKITTKGPYLVGPFIGFITTESKQKWIVYDPTADSDEAMRDEISALCDDVESGDDEIADIDVNSFFEIARLFLKYKGDDVSIVEDTLRHTSRGGAVLQTDLLNYYLEIRPAVLEFENGSFNCDNRDPMLAQQLNKKKELICTMLQVKFDGMRATTCVTMDGRYLAKTRNGQTVDVTKTFGDILCKLTIPNLDGEIITRNMKRAQCTGILNSMRQNDGEHVAMNKLSYVIFTYASREPCHIRFAKLRDAFIAAGAVLMDDPVFEYTLDDRILLPRVYNVKSVDEIDSYMHLVENQEGVMLYDPNSPYVYGRSIHLLKYKNWLYGEYPVVGVISGQGKESDCALIIVKVGPNKTQPMRPCGTYEFRRLLLKGEVRCKIAKIRYASVTDDGSLEFGIPIILYDEFHNAMF